ncbi:ubiquitin carboxyl-terminal hydrolase, partial [Colletotrichum musicola]
MILTIAVLLAFIATTYACRAPTGLTMPQTYNKAFIPLESNP